MIGVMDICRTMKRTIAKKSTGFVTWHKISNNPVGIVQVENPDLYLFNINLK